MQSENAIKQINKSTVDIYGEIYQNHYQLDSNSIQFSIDCIKADLLKMGIEELSNLSILNVGTGREVCAFLELGAQKVYHADLSPFAQEAIKILTSNAYKDQVFTKQCDICLEPLPWTEKIDLAYLNGVIHHLHSPITGIINCMRHIHIAGRFFIRIYRNDSFLFFVVSLLRRIIARKERSFFDQNKELLNSICGSKDWAYSDMYDDLFVPTLFLFNIKELVNFFQTCGFIIDNAPKLEGYNHSVDDGLVDMSFTKKYQSTYINSDFELKIIDPLLDIPYKEDFILETIDIFLKLENELKCLPLERKGILAAKVYSLTDINLECPIAVRHQNLQNLMKSYSLRTNMSI